MLARRGCCASRSYPNYVWQHGEVFLAAWRGILSTTDYSATKHVFVLLGALWIRASSHKHPEKMASVVHISWYQDLASFQHSTLANTVAVCCKTAISPQLMLHHHCFTLLQHCTNGRASRRLSPTRLRRWTTQSFRATPGIPDKTDGRTRSYEADADICDHNCR